MDKLLEIREVDGCNLYTFFDSSYRMIITSRRDPRIDVYHRHFEFGKQFRRAHFIKCIQPFFDDVHRLAKRFEIRENDRNYRDGDNIILREYDPETKKYSGKVMIAVIDYFIKGTVCLKEGYCAFGIVVIDSNMTVKSD